MGKITVPLTRALLKAIVTQGYSIPAHTVIQGVSSESELVDVSVDDYGIVRLHFDDPDAEEDGEIQVLWKTAEEVIPFLFALKAMKIAEITHWGGSSRVRFTGIKDSNFEVKFDLPVADLEISAPHEGPFFIAVGPDSMGPGGEQ